MEVSEVARKRIGLYNIFFDGPVYKNIKSFLFSDLLENLSSLNKPCSIYYSSDGETAELYICDMLSKKEKEKIIFSEGIVVLENILLD